MIKRKIWYRRHLFKNHFKSYKDWESFNPSSDFKHYMRYKSDALICRNPECPRDQMPISEHEAYYYFAKRYFWKKFFLEVLSIFRFLKFRQKTGFCYICPFCGEGDVEEFKEQILFKERGRRKYKNGGNGIKKKSF